MRRTNLFTAQWMHDYVVQAAAATATGYLVHTNLHDGHENCVSLGLPDVFPDLMLCDPETFVIQHIIEVATEQSVTPQQADRWGQIARSAHRLATSTFWILVPASTIPLTLRLCRQYEIPAHIGTWAYGPQGVSITWGQSSTAATTTAPVLQESARAAFRAVTHETSGEQSSDVPGKKITVSST